MNSANHELPSGRTKPAYYLESTFKSVPERQLPAAGSNLTWRLVKLSAARHQTHRQRKSRNLERPGSLQTELEIRAALQYFVTKSSLDFNSWLLATSVNEHSLHDPVLSGVWNNSPQTFIDSQEVPFPSKVYTSTLIESRPAPQSATSASLCNHICSERFRPNWSSSESLSVRQRPLKGWKDVDSRQRDICKITIFYNKCVSQCCIMGSLLTMVKSTTELSV